MDTEPKLDKPDPTPIDLTKTRLPDKLSQAERETFEGKIREQDEEIVKLKARITELENPPAPPEPKKKKGLLSEFCP